MSKLYCVLLIILFSSFNAICQHKEISSDFKLKFSEKSDKNNHSAFKNDGLKYFDKTNNSFTGRDFSVGTKRLKNYGSDINPDVIPKKYPIWVPIAELVAMHTGVCLFSNYVLHNEFAKISFKSVEQNFKTGFVWDPDFFVTNYFAHPFNGSLYYNLARANGYNYYVSSIFAFSGSLTWELFMETEPPAYNDIINTTLSGIFLGEVTHRLSSLLIDEKTTGFERFARELGAGLIDLPRGFNRLFQSRSWEVNRNTYRREPLALNAYYGVNWNNYGTKIGTGVANGAFGFGLLYGDPFKEKKREIMDFFRLAGQFNVGAGQPAIGSLEGYGLLFGKESKSSNKTDKLFGAFQHYDYFENEAYQIGAITFGAGWLNRIKTSKTSNLLTAIHLGIIPLGGSKSAYIDTVERTYSFNGGADTKLEIYYTGNWGLLYAGYNLYWYYTYVGAKGNELYGIFRPKVVINVSKNLGVGAQFLFAHKEAFYHDFPNVSGRTYQAMLLLQYRFGAIAF
jgi:hypothetical protein